MKKEELGPRERFRELPEIEELIKECKATGIYSQVRGTVGKESSSEFRGPIAIFCDGKDTVFVYSEAGDRQGKIRVRGFPKKSPLKKRIKGIIAESFSVIYPEEGGGEGDGSTES